MLERSRIYERPQSDRTNFYERYLHSTYGHHDLEAHWTAERSHNSIRTTRPLGILLRRYRTSLAYPWCLSTADLRRDLGILDTYKLSDVPQ